jgi:hypothetical protein
MTATDAFEASFGDPLPLTIIEPGEDAGEHYMPDPLAAQANVAASSHPCSTC